MATMALPIRELEQSVWDRAEKAQAETERVVAYSGARRADLGTALKVAATTVCLKWLLSELVRYQNRLIRECTKRDFSRCSAEGLGEMASSLDGIVAKEQRILSEADKLGAEIRVWWSASLDRLATQVEYLES